MAPVDSFRFCSRGGLWGRGRSPRSLGPARGRPSGRFRCYARSCGLGWRRRHRAGLPGRGERLRYVKDAGGPRGEPGLCAGLCAAGPALRCARPAVSSGQVPREERGGAGRDLPGAGRGAARLPFRSVLRPDRASAASRRCFPEGGGGWTLWCGRPCCPDAAFLILELDSLWQRERTAALLKSTLEAWLLSSPSEANLLPALCFWKPRVGADSRATRVVVDASRLLGGWK